MKSMDIRCTDDNYDYRKIISMFDKEGIRDPYLPDIVDPKDIGEVVDKIDKFTLQWELPNISNHYVFHEEFRGCALTPDGSKRQTCSPAITLHKFNNVTLVYEPTANDPLNFYLFDEHERLINGFFTVASHNFKNQITISMGSPRLLTIVL